eukprot:COSAG02_NODE_6566_length_3494_cov_11.517983_1_plen_59_part_00
MPILDSKIMPVLRPKCRKNAEMLEKFPVCDTGHLGKCPVSQTGKTGHTRRICSTDRAH